MTVLQTKKSGFFCNCESIETLLKDMWFKKVDIDDTYPAEIDERTTLG